MFRNKVLYDTGSTAIDVAAMYGQLTMKTFLEGCALFRGTLKMSIPVTFGTKQKNRYANFNFKVQPDFQPYIQVSAQYVELNQLV